MTRTAYDEHYGVGTDVSISADYVLRLTFGENGAACYVVRPTVGGTSVRLPPLGFARLWDRYTVTNLGSFSTTIRDVVGTSIYVLAVGERVTLTCVDATTLWGTWVKRVTSATAGTTLVHDRVPLVVIFGTWAGTGINLRSYCDDVFGYDGAQPASIYCQLRNSIVIGSEISSQAAFDTGTWPSGTTMLLEIGSGCQIVGIGGEGGAGGSAPAPLSGQPGFTGGDAIVTRINTAIVNHGIISGGGGGGGGGNHYPPNNAGGGGGGGGAGYQPSRGGPGGLGGGTLGNGSPGGQGTIGVGGVGGPGGAFGGPGGAPGVAGSTGAPGSTGGPGGSPGNAIKRLSSVTVTKIVPGTINGPEVSF